MPARMDISSEALAPLCAADPEFMLAARHWDGGSGSAIAWRPYGSRPASRSLATPARGRGLLTNGFAHAAYMSAFVIAPLFLVQVFGDSTTVVAFIMLTRTVSLTLSSPVGGHLDERLGERHASLLGCLPRTASLGLIA